MSYVSPFAHLNLANDSETVAQAAGSWGEVNLAPCIIVVLECLIVLGLSE